MNVEFSILNVEVKCNYFIIENLDIGEGNFIISNRDFGAFTSKFIIRRSIFDITRDIACFY